MPPGTPTLDEFIAHTKPLNPGYSDADIAAEYHTRYPSETPTADLPTFDAFKAHTQPLNPDYTDDEIKQEWLTRYPGAREEPSSLLRRSADIPLGIAKGVIDLPKAGLGLMDVVTGGDAGRGATLALAALGKDADALGLPRWARPAQWSSMLEEQYSPETRAAVRHAAEETTRATEEATARGEDWLGQIAASAAGTATGLAKHPSAAIPLIAENLPQMYAVAKGVALALKPLQAALDAKVVAGTLTTDAADAILGKAASRAAAIGEGLMASGQVSSQISAETPDAGFVEHLAAAAAGAITGGIAKGAGAIPGLNNPEAVLARKLLGRPAGFTGGIVERVGKGVLAEGIIQEPLQSAQEQIWQNVAEGKPWHEGVGEQAVQGLVAGTAIGGTAGAFGGPATISAPPPSSEPEPPIASHPVTDILAAETTDEAIQKAHATLDAPALTTGDLDTFIRQQQEIGATVLDTATKRAEIEADTQSLTNLADSLPEARELTTPLNVIHPTDLPPTTGPDEGLSQEKHEVLSAIAGVFGKRVLVYRGDGLLPDAMVNRSIDPTIIAISHRTQSADLFSTFAHEALHLMTGTEFYKAFGQTVFDQLTPESKQLAIARHGKLDDDALFEEVTADIAGTELQKPEVWERVYTQLQANVGDQKAHTEVLGFIDTIKGLIAKVKTLIASRPWSTGSGAAQKTLAEQYVKDLTKVHEALAATVANAIKEERTKGAAPTKPAQASRSVIHPEAALRFTELAKAQRGKPEAAMLRVQEALGGGVLNPVVEHVGDLTHRMTEMAQHGFAGRPIVQEKVNRAITTLTHVYGFEKEHQENLTNNARARGVSPGEAQKAVDEALAAYAAAHRALSVYNHPQWLAREAAVAVGEKRFEDAVAHLKELKTLVDAEDFTDQAFAHERSADQSIQKYAKPIAAKLIGVQKTGNPEFPDFELFNLDEDLPGHPIGSTVSRDTIENAGRRPVPTDIITEKQAARLQTQSEKGTKASTAKKEGSKNENKGRKEGSTETEKADTILIADLHDLADAKGIVWDNSNAFMDFTERTTGKRHLDDLTQAERKTLYDALKKRPSQATERAIVNIGLNVNDGSKITKADVLAALKDTGVSVVSSSVQTSNTEPTVIATLDRPLTEKEAHAISVALKQESIAQLVGEKGELYGPGADKWRPFNPEYFLMPKEGKASKSVTLEHYSKQKDLKEISPKFHGTGQIGAERTRMQNDGTDYVKRSYFYRKGTKPEARFTGLTKYTVNVPEYQLVDLATLKGTSTQREQAAKKQGYLGFYNSESSMPEAVALFEPVSTSTGPRFSPSIWFSQLGNVLDAKMPKSASKEQVKNIIQSGGVKQDEVKWTGILDYIDAQKFAIDKEALLQWLSENNVKVKEVVKWGKLPTGADDLPDVMPIAEFNRRWNPNGTHQVFDDVQIDSHGKDGREGYTVRVRDGYLGQDLTALGVVGKEDAWIFDTFNEASEAAYEYLVAEPDRQFREDLERADDTQDTQYEGYKLPGGTDYTELLLTLPTKEDKLLPWPARELPENKGFQGPHFDERNILAHVRFDTRTDADGKTVLFLEEVQSDWAETGRKNGFAKDTRGWTAQLLSKPDAGFSHWQVNDADGNYVTKVVGGSEESAIHKAAEGVPAAPFVGNTEAWVGLVLKRMLRWAAEHNYDRLAWTTGAQQNERYGLSKHVDSIQWDTLPTKNVTNVNIILITGQHIRFNVNPQGIIQSSDPHYSANELFGKSLNEVIGKDAAEKILSKYAGGMGGNEIEIGGSGMKYFYDQMLPKFMEKYLKRFGTKVEAREIKTFSPTGKEADVHSVHSIALTPEMKDSVINKGQPMFSPSRNVAPTYPVEPPGKLDKIIRVLQNKNIDIQRVVEAIRSTGATIPESLNPVLAEEMYAKRDEQRAKDYTNDELRPFIDKMRLNKLTLKQVDDYAHARHVVVDKLNARLKAMNPTLPNNDALSGMTDADAKKILASAPPILSRMMRDLDDMVNTTRDLMVQYGLEKQSTIDGWRNQYLAYVPLRREGFDEQGHPTGQGRSVRGSTVKQRGGSNLAVENVLANIAQARDQVVTRGEKMRPVIAFAGLSMLHPNPAIATLDKPATITYTDPVSGLPVTVPGNLANYEVPTVRRFNPQTGTMQTYPDPMYQGRDNVVNFRVNGEDYAIVFNERNDRAMEVAKAFKNLGTAQLNGLMNVVAPYTRYLAAINTQYNPIFGIVNFVRDAQFAMLTLGSTPLQGKQATVLKNALVSLRGIYADARGVRKGVQPSSPMSRMWQRFEHVGGPTGYRDLFFTSEERAKEIQRMLDPHSWTTIRNPQDLGKHLEETPLFRWLSDYNTTMENAIRLGVFKTAVESGISDLQAASYAKNITVNFNKKGQIGAQMGALYAFFNANVQGTARIAETLFEKTPTGVRLSSIGKKIVVGGVLVGVLQTFALAMGGFDEDDPPEFVKQKNLIIPVPGTAKGYVMFPMPLGFNLLPNIGRLAAEAIVNVVHGKSPGAFEKGASLIASIFNTLSPTGGSGGIAQDLSPTVTDPAIALSTNKDWTGRSIAKEDHSSLDPTPGYSRAHDTATAWAKSLSKAVNWATGGTDYVPGVLSPTPDQIDFLIQQMTGGVGREFSKGAQVIQSTGIPGILAGTGEEVPTHKIPLAGRFMGSATGSSSIRSRFFENIRAANLAYREFEGRATHKEPFSEYITTHPEARFAKVAIEVERDLTLLNKQKKRMVEQGANREAVRLQEMRITSLMTRFNELVEKAQAPRTPAP